MTRTSFFLALTITASALVFAGCGENAQTYSYSWWKVSFDTPISFSGPIEIGIGAVTLVHPSDSEPGQAGIEITLVSVPKDLQQSFENDESEILTFVKSTFLGTFKPADENFERTFLGKKIVGSLQDITIPHRGQLEMYLVPLSDGDMIAVALMHSAETPKQTAREVIEMVAASMQEIPAK